MQVQELVWLEGEDEAAPRAATPMDLHRRAEEIAGDLGMNPYYRCYATADGFLAVACLNVVQRRAFLDLFDLDDSTVEAPDLVPHEASVLAGKQELTAEIARRIADEQAAAWLERLAAAGVPASPVLMRESVHADEQIAASGLLERIEQPGLGSVRMLGSLVGGAGRAEAAPLLGADTDAVLGELA